MQALGVLPEGGDRERGTVVVSRGQGPLMVRAKGFGKGSELVQSYRLSVVVGAGSHEPLVEPMLMLKEWCSTND